ncbi:MAG TPA: glycosyltransferase family 2 protein [Elusimicrobiota bacterium]|nr:glycosyltransferase family 2 protein [Elusimicrobiota bacterium]
MPSPRRRDIKVSAVLPALNEAAAVAGVVASVRDVLSALVEEFEVIVVDDGSSDGTGEAARQAGAIVLRHAANKGYGRALMSGIAAAKHDWILTIDADESYPVSEAAGLVKFAPDFDLIIGSRTGIHFWGSPFHALLRWLYLRMASFVVGEDIPDANSGLRLFRRQLAMGIGPVRCYGYSYSTTMTLSFLHEGRFVKFIPIKFQARKGKSKVKPIRDILRTLQLMLEIMIAYNPIKLFIALAALPALTGLAATIAFLATWRAGWALCALLGLGVAGLSFASGCLLDSLRLWNYER